MKDTRKTNTEKWDPEKAGQPTPGSREAEMVVLRRREDGKPTVWCDPEIVDLVDALNNGKLATVCSCSGHGEKPGMIMLADGRELVILPDFDTSRRAEALLHGNRVSLGFPPHGDSSSIVQNTYVWLPIDTAPKEGVWALVYAGGAINCAFVEAGKLPDDWTDPSCPNVLPEDVTHWMPLPVPPGE